MKKIYKSNWLFKVRSMALAMGLILSGSLAMAQLSGTYTIDSSMATSGTNFASFNDFADTIAVYGVSGAVTVNVVANSGPYNENFELTAINNTSATNTVTINGNGNTIAANGWVINLNGADYVKIDNLVIKATGTANGTGGVWLHNSSNNNTVSNCEIIVSAFTGTTTGTAYVWLSNSSTSLTSGTHGINNVFEDNYMWGGGTSGVGPYYGIAEYRSSSNTTSNTILDGNEIRDVYYYYTYFYYSRNVQVTNNDLHTNRVGSPNNYGFYNYYGYKSTYTGNEVHDMDPSSYMYVSYLYYCNGTSTDYSTYSNNDFYNLESNYIYYNRIYYSNYTNVENNQVYNNEASSYNYYGYYIYYSSYSNIINNTFSNNESGNYNYYGYYLYYSTNCELIDNKFTQNKASNYNYYGYYLYYSGNSTVKGNEYGGNSANYNYYGFYLYQSTNLDVYENSYYGNSATYNYYAFYTYYCANSEIKYNEYYGNKGDYCYYAWMLYYSDNSVLEGNVCRDNNPNYYLGYIYYVYQSNSSYIINNMYYGNDPGYANYYTLYLGYSDPVVFAHNTFIVDNNVDYYHYMLWYIYYYNTPNDVQVKNNIMYIDGTSGFGYHYPIYVYYNADQIDWGYNVWWDVSPTTTKYHYANAATYNTFPLWMEAAGDETSVIVNPMFANMAGGDFTPTNPEIANMGEPGLASLDFDKDTRTACGPDPGALEFFIDHSASNLVFSGTNECGNYMEEISVDFNNGTSVDMEDVEMFYTINGIGRVAEYIDAVKANSSATHTFATIPTFNTPGNNTLTVGLGCDDDASNNTISHNIFITPSPSGGDLVEGTTWNGYWNTGNMSNPDVTVPSEVSVYEIVSPTKYNNGEYGTKWTMTHNTMTSGGMSVGASKGFTFSAPAGVNPGKITVDPDVSLTDSMVYVSVIINDLVTGCDSTIGRWMYIPYTPNPDFVPNNVCFGDVSQNQNTSTMGGKDVMAFKWKFGDPNDPSDTLEAKLGVWQYTTFGTFDVTLEVVNFTYPKFVYSITKQVTILPTPEINFQIVNACEGTDIQFINNTTLPVPGNISYVWNFGDGSSTTTTKNPTHLYASTKAEGYVVTLEAEANGCVSSKSKKAYQFATPHANFETNGACNLEEIKFVNKTQIAIGKAGYNWDFGDNGISTVKDPVHIYSTPGTKSVTLRTFSEFGCEDEITIDVVLLESPEADFEIDQACNLTPVQFTRTGSIPGTANDNAFEWNFNGQGTSQVQNPNFLFSQIGKKEVTLKISSLNGCSSTITKEFNVALQADPDFDVKDICEGDEAVFTNKSKVSAGDLTYKWFFGDSDSSQFVSPRHKYETTGTTRVVNVTLRAIVDGGCNAEISKPLTVNAAPDASFGVDKSGRDIMLDGPSGMSVYQWRFGNGASANTEDPMYTYDNIDNETFTVCLTVKNDLCWSEYCEEVNINLQGVEDLTNDNSMATVYPNPNNGVFTVEVADAGDDVSIVVVDVLGNVIAVDVVDNMNGNYVVNMSGVADGVYFVQVKNGDYYATKRITVQN